MPRDYYRVEVHFSSQTNQHLDDLAEEVRERTGKRPSRSTVVKNIVEEFLSKTRLAFQEGRSK